MALERLLAEDIGGGATLLVALLSAADPSLAARAHELAGRLLLRACARHASDRPGGPLRTFGHGASEGDLDLDRTLDAVAHARAARRPVHDDELVLRGPRGHAHGVCLVVDHSGSMQDGRLATAALAAAALVLRDPARTAVVAFAEKATILYDPSSEASPVRAVDRVLSLQGHGRTDLAAGLTLAAGALGRLPARRRTVLLLSDTHSTTGDDPLGVARGLDDLRILAPDAAARGLAAAAQAAVRIVHGPAELLGALHDVLVR